MDWSRQSQKKASSAASVFKKFISTTGHGSAFDKRCSRCYTVSVGFSLKFSLVKNLKMLLQAKRQPGYKIPGRVVDRAYRMTQMTKIGYEKLKDKTWSWSLLWPPSSKNTPLNYQMQKLLKVKCKSKILKRTMLRYSIQTSRKF